MQRVCRERKIENIEDDINLDNVLNYKKEQPEHNGSDCSHLVLVTRLGAVDEIDKLAKSIYSSVTGTVSTS